MTDRLSDRRLSDRTQTSTAGSAEAAPPSQRIKVMTVLVWVTTAAIFCQAVIAGQFVSQEGKDTWVTVHGVVADLSWVLTLVSAGYAFFALRASFPVLVRWSGVLFVVTLIQTGIGHLITDKAMDWLIWVHVPLAFVVFAAAGYLSVWAFRVRHQVAEGHLHRAVEVGGNPNADVHHVVRPTDPH
jgi:hypothetical protein